MGFSTNTFGERECEGLRLYALVVNGFRSLRRKPINSMLNLANQYKNIFFNEALCPIQFSAVRQDFCGSISRCLLAIKRTSHTLSHQAMDVIEVEGV